MYNKLNWDDIKPFLAVARLGTLSAAAIKMRIGISTLSRRIERLEDSLGVRLFIRSQSGYQLTQDGQALIDVAELLETTALSLTSAATSRTEISGVIRFATAETLATEIIIPSLPRLMQRFPRINLELITDAQPTNLSRRDADLALRMVKPDRGNVSLQRVGTLGWGLYANETYLLQHPLTSSEQVLSGQSVIDWCKNYSDLTPARWIKSQALEAAQFLSTSSLQTQAAAARAGLGIAILPHYLGRRASLRCVRASLGLDQPIYLVTQCDLAQSARVRVMSDFLREIMAEKRMLLTGG